jgi:hypothetical protein
VENSGIVATSPFSPFSARHPGQRPGFHFDRLKIPRDISPLPGGFRLFRRVFRRLVPMKMDSPDRVRGRLCFRSNDGIGPDESGILQCPSPRATNPGSFSAHHPGRQIRVPSAARHPEQRIRYSSVPVTPGDKSGFLQQPVTPDLIRGPCRTSEDSRRYFAHSGNASAVSSRIVANP